jgi:nitrite reductase (NADH) small subunit
MSDDATSTTEPLSADAVWRPVATSEDLARRRKIVVEVDDHQVFVLSHEGKVCAFDNICIHKQRELSKGVVLNGKIVCPGHQWAFALCSGWEAVKEQCQPTWLVEERDGQVWLDVTSRAERPPTS